MADLARVLGVTRTFVYHAKHGRRRWPYGYLHRIATFLDAAQASVVGVLDGPWQPLERPRYPRTRASA